MMVPLRNRHRRPLTSQSLLPLSDRGAGTLKRTLALIGFMGAGKSVVGKKLADRMNVPFVDLDAEVVRDTGKTIPQLFKEFGEVGFRARERSALRRLLHDNAPFVIATGGGTASDSEMGRLLQEATDTVYLSATTETLHERLATREEQDARPLLQGPDLELVIKRLLAKRVPDYQRAKYQLDVDGKTVDELVNAIVELMTASGEAKQETPRPSTDTPVFEEGMDTTITVQASRHTYEVEFQAEAGEWIVDRIQKLSRGDSIVVISDTQVGPLHAERIERQLNRAGVRLLSLRVKPGESAKSWQVAGQLAEEILEWGIDRRTCLVAVGGGVVGDLTGFVASLLLRGIDFIQVPTSTLAVVDSSVGGKTAVNSERGKNLIGTFHPPLGVLIAVSHLQTQTRYDHRNGLIEALKVGAILDAEYVGAIADVAHSLLDFRTTKLVDILAHSIRLKAHVVSQDERDNGLRTILNYGHTVGHALEAGSRYTLPHGEAVGFGMLAEAEFAEEQGWSSGVVPVLSRTLRELECGLAWRQLTVDTAALRTDKKRAGNHVVLPVAPVLGSHALHTVEIETLSAFVSGGEG